MDVYGSIKYINLSFLFIEKYLTKNNYAVLRVGVKLLVTTFFNGSNNHC